MFFFKQKTAYEMRISDWSSDVCSSDLLLRFSSAFPRLHELIDVSIKRCGIRSRVLLQEGCITMLTRFALELEEAEKAIAAGLAIARESGWDVTVAEIGRAHV